MSSLDYHVRTYTVSRHSNKTAESTVEATKKDADEEGDDNQGPLSPDAVSRPDEDDIAPASESDFPEVSHEGMRAEVRPGKDDQKSLLADGIEAALKSDKIKRVEEVWSECVFRFMA